MAGDEFGSTTLGQPHLARQDLSTLVSVSLTDLRAMFIVLVIVGPVCFQNEPLKC